MLRDRELQELISKIDSSSNPKVVSWQSFTLVVVIFLNLHLKIEQGVLLLHDTYLVLEFKPI